MDFLAGFIFGAVTGTIFMAGVVVYVYKGVVDRFTTEGDGTRIIESGGEMYAMVRITE